MIRLFKEVRLILREFEENMRAVKRFNRKVYPEKHLFDFSFPDTNKYQELTRELYEKRKEIADMLPTYETDICGVYSFDSLRELSLWHTKTSLNLIPNGLAPSLCFVVP